MGNLENEKKLFYENVGYRLNLNNPKSLNEKIVYKKIHDRNPLLILTTDKYRARQYIRDKIGKEAEEHLVPIIWVGKYIKDIPFDDLPGSYIIKPNNASGRYIIAKGDKYFVNRHNKIIRNVTKEQLIKICNDWFKTIYGLGRHEWV